MKSVSTASGVAHVHTPKIPAGTVWMRDSWECLNRLTTGAAAIPDQAVDLFWFGVASLPPAVLRTSPGFWRLP